MTTREPPASALHPPALDESCGFELKLVLPLGTKIEFYCPHRPCTSKLIGLHAIPSEVLIFRMYKCGECGKVTRFRYISAENLAFLRMEPEAPNQSHIIPINP